MTVGELVSILKKFDSKTEVVVTDGYEALCYRGQYEVQLFQDDDGKYVVDIGIGGLRE
jgi:hypothetical protein